MVVIIEQEIQSTGQSEILCVYGPFSDVKAAIDKINGDFDKELNYERDLNDNMYIEPSPSIRLTISCVQGEL